MHFKKSFISTKFVKFLKIGHENERNSMNYIAAAREKEQRERSRKFAHAFSWILYTSYLPVIATIIINNIIIYHTSIPHHSKKRTFRILKITSFLFLFFGKEIHRKSRSMKEVDWLYIHSTGRREGGKEKVMPESIQVVNLLLS